MKSLTCFALITCLLILTSCEKSPAVLGGGSHAEITAESQAELWPIYLSLHQELKRKGFHPSEDPDSTDWNHFRVAYVSKEPELEDCQLLLEFSHNDSPGQQLSVSSSITANTQEKAQQKQAYLHQQMTEILPSVADFRIHDLD